MVEANIIIECTAKAISHRLQILKKKAGGSNSNSTSKLATPKRPATTGLATPLSTPRAPKPSTPRAPKPASHASLISTGYTNGRKRARAEKSDDEAQFSGDENDEVAEKYVKSYDDVESGDDAGSPIDRSALRRSVSTKPSDWIGMEGSGDSDDSDEKRRVSRAKRVKVEVEG